MTGGSHGSGSGSQSRSRPVAPEFDSGMNQGTDQDEMERLENFEPGGPGKPDGGAVGGRSRGRRAIAERRGVGGRRAGFAPEGPTTYTPLLQFGGYRRPWHGTIRSRGLGPLGFSRGFGGGAGNPQGGADTGTTPDQAAPLDSPSGGTGPDGTVPGTGPVPGPNPAAGGDERR